MPFTRAGWNPNHRRIARAVIASRGHYRAELIAFDPSGDLCWYSKQGRFLTWEARVVTRPELDAALRQALTDCNQADDSMPYCVWALEQLASPFPQRRHA